MAAPSPEQRTAIRRQLDRIAASPVFAHAGRMHPLLRYLVEAELAGDGERLNQSRIAIDVFGRNASFDPAVDSIVRVEVGRLRNKLREYYATDGREDEVVFELPKGRYRPRITIGEAGGDLEPAAAKLAAAAEQRDRSRGRQLRYGGVGILLLVMAWIAGDKLTEMIDVQPPVTTMTTPPRAASAIEQRSTQLPPTASPEAYALYLKSWDVPPPERLTLLNEALALDPNFALAHAATAMVYSQSLTNTALGPVADESDLGRVEELTRHHAERARDLEPSVELAHIAVGNLYFYTWRWTEARRAFERAVTSTPDEPGLLQYAYLDSYSGRHGDAIARLEHLIEKNPGFTLLHSMLGLHQAYAKQYGAAAASLRTGLVGARLNSSQPIERGWLAAVEIARGNTEAAARELALIEQLSDLTSPAQLPSMAHAYARAGRAADAKRLFDQFEQAAADGHRFGAGAWAEAYLAIGEQVEALERLESAAQRAARHEPDADFYALMNLRMNVLADPVLDRPEFVAVLRRISGD